MPIVTLSSVQHQRWHTQHHHHVMTKRMCIALLIFCALFKVMAMMRDSSGEDMDSELSPFISVSKVMKVAKAPTAAPAAAETEEEDEDAERKRQHEAAVFAFANAMANEREAQYEGPPPGRDLVDAPILQDIPIQFKPKNNWHPFSRMPDVYIVGMPKAGTSQLGRILASHPLTMKFNYNSAEECAYYAQGERVFEPILGKASFTDEQKEQTHRGLFTYFSNKPAIAKKNGRMSVGTCLNVRDVILRSKYLELVGSLKRKSINRTKFILLLRDPADWLWSLFCFWFARGHDAGAPMINDWAQPDLQYRSPELFHELIASANRTNWGNFLIVQQREILVRSGRELVAAFGNENVHFGKNEDMLPEVVEDPGGFLDQLSNFTGLSRKGFPSTTAHAMTNCNANKGNKAKCTKKSAAYEIAGKRDMFPETRKLIYIQFHRECKIWKEEFGVSYDDCLNVM